MKIKIIRATIAQKRQVEPGEELEVSKEEGIQLIGAGKAVALKSSAVETTEAPTYENETTSLPAVNTETFEPTVKRGKKKASES